MENKKVSVLIPVFNAEAYIQECLESILNQSYNNIEVIIVNDGSTDKSYEIIQKFMDKDKRIKIYNQSNSGVSVTRNKAKELATGEYVLYVDSDDTLSGNAIEELVFVAEKTQSDLVIFDYNEILNGKVNPKGNDSEIIKEMNRHEACLAYIFGSSDVTFIIWRKLYRKEILDKVNFPKDMLPEDMATGFDFLYNSNKIVHYNKCLYNYKVLSNSLTKKAGTKHQYDIYKMWCNEYIKRKKAYPELNKILTSQFFNSLVMCMYGYSKTKNNLDYKKECHEKIKNIKIKDLNFKSRIIFILYFCFRKLLYFIININETRRLKRRK